MSTRTWARVTGTVGQTRGHLDTVLNRLGSWSKLRALGPDLSSPGQLVDTLRTRTRARHVQHSGSKPRSLGPGHESSVKALDPVGTKTQAGISQDRWSTLRDLGHKCELPGRTGRPHGHTDTSPSRPGYLVKPAEPRTRPVGPLTEVPGQSGRTRGHSDQGPSRPG